MRRAAAAAMALPLVTLAASPAAAEPPTIEVGAEWYDTAPCVVYFENGTIDDDGDDFTDFWDFGDGETSTSPFPLHAFEAGSWTVTYTATDTTGESATDQLNDPITCEPPGTTPFTDIATSFARTQIASLYGKLIAAGTTATTYSPGAAVTREQMAIFLIKTFEDAQVFAADPPTSTPFTDIGSSFAEDAIAQIYDLAITAGCTATRYCPQNVVTREQMAVFLVRLWDELEYFDPLPEPTPADLDRFSDISNSFAEREIAQLVKLGITSGTSPTTFSPTQAVTREQMAAFLMALERALI